MSGRRFLSVIALTILGIAVAFSASYFLLISRDKADAVALKSFDEVVQSKNWKQSEFSGPTFSSDSSDLFWNYCWNRRDSGENVCIVIERRPLDVKAYIRGSDSTPFERFPLNL